MNECEHVWRHLETVRWCDHSGSYNTGFNRVDRYYCERCLKAEEKKQTATQRETPDWYRRGE